MVVESRMDEADLWDMDDHPGMRKRIEEGTIEEWGRAFPLEYGNVRMEAKNLRYSGKDRFTLADQRKAWMENRMLNRSLKADLELFDKTTGEQLDGKTVTLMRVPYYTDRGDFVYNGNHFTGTIQSRMIPGIYTRRQNNGILESQINTRNDTGRPFRVALDPEDGQFRLRAKGSDLHLYSVLKDAGVGDDELAEAWGPEVLELNRKKYDSRALGKAVSKMVPTYEQAETDSNDAKATKFIAALDKALVAKRSTDKTIASYWTPRMPLKTASRKRFNAVRQNIMEARKKAGVLPPPPKFDVRTQIGDIDDEGDEYRPVGIEGVLASTRKLLAVNKGLDKTDERNIPAFSKVYPMDRLMRERIRLDEGKIRRNLLRMVSTRRNLSPISDRAFDPYYLEVITKHPTTTPIEETNPLQAIAQHRRVTMMGPGGIGSDDAITTEMQAVNADEFGFYSPVEGPESSRAGVDVRLAVGTRIGKDGRVYRKLKNRATGEYEWMSPETMFGRGLRLPD